MIDAPGGDLAQAGWRYLCETAGVVVLQLDATLTIRFANRHACTLTGRQLSGCPLSEIVLGVPEEEPGRWLADAAAGSRMINVRTADGLPETLYVSLAAVGADRLLFGQIDVGEQARLRREVLVLNHELGNLSRELARSNADLAALNEQKTEFLGMATHDLRKPAGLALLCAEMLAEELGAGLTADQRRLLATIGSATERMRGVIDDFLDVAMIEAGRLNLEVRTTSVSAVLETPLLLVKAATERRGIAIEVALDLSGRALRVDGPKIEQVFTNLLSNAIEHAPDGSMVRVVGAIVDGGARFSVSDAGPGIPEGQRAWLFGPFSAAGGKKKDGERSVGLGLAISRRIVEAHGGTMFADSLPGAGAAVGFTLPAACVVEAPLGRRAGGGE
jgi:signal transduction histidine kinase